MVASIASQKPERSVCTIIESAGDFDKIQVGGVVLVRAELDFDSYGKSKNELWQASYKSVGERQIQYDLRLTGIMFGLNISVPFSSQWVRGSSSFTVLVHYTPAEFWVLGTLLPSKTEDQVAVRPLAFGMGPWLSGNDGSWLCGENTYWYK